MSTPMRGNAIYAMLRSRAPVLSETIDPKKDALYPAVPISGSSSGRFWLSSFIPFFFMFRFPGRFFSQLDYRLAQTEQ